MRLQLRDLLKAKLLPYQYDLVFNQSDRLIVRKSRRTGYTWAQALRMVLLAANGRHQNIISMRFDASKLVLEDCVYWIEFLSGYGLTSIKSWQIQKHTIRHNESGATIAALPCVPRLVRGRKGDVFIDEAAHLPLLPDILDAARPLQLWGGRVTMVSSPFLPGLFTDLESKSGWDCTRIDIYEAVRQGLHRRICFESGLPEPTPEDSQQWIQSLLADAGSSANQEYLCADVSDVGGDWITPNSTLSPVQVTAPSLDDGYRHRLDQPHSIGVDVGVADHPTVVSWVGGEGVLQCVEFRGAKIPQIASFLMTTHTHQTTAIAIDTNGIGRGLADSLSDQLGTLIKYVPNTSQWFSSECMRFLGRVWDGSASIPDHPSVLGDIQHTTLQSGKLVLLPRSTPNGKRHCDSIPSLAMAYQFQPSNDGVHSVWG
jgi:phage FluMu gp28-like protein